MPMHEKVFLLFSFDDFHIYSKTKTKIIKVNQNKFHRRTKIICSLKQNQNVYVKVYIICIETFCLYHISNIN